MDVSSSPAAIGRRMRHAAAVPANLRVPSHDVQVHDDDNDGMMMTTMMTIGLSSLTLHGRGGWDVRRGNFWRFNAPWLGEW